ncbi:MAG TPA: phosphoribosylglycinamide formyltransferase [Bacteroidia bacterium]|nr:phosphoribosylglycinamide formyltransferase [Bacteroidia bacterium]
MKHIAIFASGEGTNAENITRYFEPNDVIKVAIVLSDQRSANVLKRAERLYIPFRSFTKQEFYETDEILNLLKELKIDLIVLAGFLKLIPEKIIREFKGRIINIHPALLPKFGGKGMYGMNVHQAVYAAKEKETGITIHHVNEKFDEGEIIFQKKFFLDENDSPEKILEKIRKLELEFYPKVIEKMLA